MDAHYVYNHGFNKCIISLNFVRVSMYKFKIFQVTFHRTCQS